MRADNPKHADGSELVEADKVKTDVVKTMSLQNAFDGQPAHLVELTNQAGMRVVLMDIGATWLSCRLPLASGELREVLLGMGTMEDFMRQTSYMGVTVGRYANRIANGFFSIKDRQYHVSTNQAGNCLHGGRLGLDKRRWQIAEQSQYHVVFSTVSHDGDQGFPGELSIQVTYTLTEHHGVTISYEATTTHATPCNLTNHAYFNLLGANSGADCHQHWLKVAANQYLPTTDKGIPFGELMDVAGSSFDFRDGKVIAKDWMVDQQQRMAKGYDHSFLFSADREVYLPVAEVVSPDNKVRMNVITNKPAMQLYTGNWLAGTPKREGGEYRDFSGVALETQFLPDSPNHPEWPQPDCILHPKQTYHYFTTYQFEC